MNINSTQRFRYLLVIGIAEILLSRGAFAQNSEAADAPAALADVAELEPAVDVSALPRARRTQASSGGRVMDTLNLETTSVTGSQELPKVLYIVPWKQSDLGDLVGRPVNTLLDEILAPVDPEVFERHLEYYDVLYGDAEEE